MHQFDADRDAVIERAAAAGVAVIINPAIDLNSCRRVLMLAEQHPGLHVAVGVHPNGCADFDGETVARLRDMAGHPKVVAIGEIGLDYYWNKVAVDQQRRALGAQLALAAEFGLPVILHSREPAAAGRDLAGGEIGRCNVDILREIEQWVPAARKRRGNHAILGVWHAFSGDLAQAQIAYDLGLVLGLGGPVTFQNARRLQALVPQLRLDRLMLETDAPYLTPHPYRGKRNEPALIPLIAQALADQLGITLAAVAAQTTVTAERCFRFREV